MGRDFYLLPIGYGKKGVLFHSPSFNVNLVDNYEQLGDVTDEMLYELLPDLKEIHTENIEKTVGIGKIGLTFMSSRFCNLKCIYCFAGEGEYGRKRDKPKGMTASSYIEVVKKSLQLYPQGISSINFFGGEPMLNWKEIHKFVDALSGILEQKGLSRPCIGISTNGTIMNAEIAQYFKRENIVVGISLDGTKYINDRARK